MRPLAKAATMLPPTAFRFDAGAAVTVFARYLPQILTGGTDGLKLLGSFKKVSQRSLRAVGSRLRPRLCSRFVNNLARSCAFKPENKREKACLRAQVLDEDGSITDPFIRNYLDLLCFLLSGLPSDGTIAAEVAFMFNVRLPLVYVDALSTLRKGLLRHMRMQSAHIRTETCHEWACADLVQARGAAGVPGGRLAGHGQRASPVRAKPETPLRCSMCAG